VAFTEPVNFPFGGDILSTDFNVYLHENMRAMGPHRIARRTTDQLNNTTTLADENQLVMPSIAANEAWLFWWVLWISAVSTSDIKFGFTFPAGGNVGSLFDTISGSRSITNVSGSETTCSGAVNASWPAPHMLKAMYVQGGTAGILQLKFAPAAAGSMTNKTHSTLWGVRLSP
jgi:hypothetical protein